MGISGNLRSDSRALIAAILVPLFLGAQQQTPPAATPDTGTVKFQANAQLVVEMVTVKDKDGKTIEGLTARDFTITENGAPQNIAFCEFQKLDDPAEAPGLIRRDSPTVAAPTVRSVTANQIAGEPPGDIRYKNRRLLVLYFDMSSMPIPDQLRSFSAAQKFLQRQMLPADLVAIMTFANGSVRVLNDFTDDRDGLLLTIQKLVAVDEGMEDTDDDTDTGSAFGQDDSEFNLFNTDRQLAALQTAVNMLGHLNEKKSLIYFASGMRLSGVDNQAQMRSATNAAIRANVTLFTVDARGLVAMAPMGDATRGSQGGIGMYTGGAAMGMMNAFQRSQDTLYALASDTGGKTLLDNNDLSVGIVNAQKAYTSYYVIGYYTNNGTLDGKFRRINISLKEYASAKLDYRQGYFAGKVFGKFTTAEKERQLEDALMLGDPITELTIAMEVNYFQLNRAEYYVPVVMKIPGSELVLARKGGFERTVIDFIGEIKDEFGSTIQNIRDKVDIKLTDATAAELAKRPIEYDTGYTILPGSYTIKVLARDNETGRIGTYMGKFVIPNLNKEDKRVAISSVVLSSQRVDLHDAIYTAGKDKEQVANPLVQDGQKLIPSVTRVFSKEKDLYVYLQAYDQIAAAPQPLVAFVTFYRGRAKAFETAPIEITERLNNRLRTAPLKFSLNLGKLPTGKYNCQVTVLDPSNQKAAFWQAPVMLAP